MATWTNPRTWTDTEEPTAATITTHTTGNLLKVNTENKWVPLQLQNGWSWYNADWGAPALKIQAGRVFLAAMLQPGTWVQDTTVFNLPEPYRPNQADTLIFTAIGWAQYWVRFDLQGTTSGIPGDVRFVTAQAGMPSNGWCGLWCDWALE